MIVAIVGPTGVGKTKLSIMLAKKYNGIIINCDAAQIYKELNIGTAKIKEKEKENIPHFLFDIKNVDEDYSVCDYQKDLRKILLKYKDRFIIIVGGTGLYLKAGLYDYQFNSLNNEDYSKYSNEELLQMGKKKNPNLKIHINNRIRLENYLKRKENNLSSKLLYKVEFIGLTTSRDILYERINKRVDEMFKQGLEEEVKNLYNKYPDARILKRAIGYKEVISYLNHQITKKECLEQIKKNSRHYAKRQYTWFNNQMKITWFTTDFDNFDTTFKNVNNYLNKKINY